MVNALVPALEEAIARGEVKPFPPHALAHMILGNINGLQMHHCLKGQSHADDLTENSVLRSSESAADFLTAMLFDGLAQHPA